MSSTPVPAPSIVQLLQGGVLDAELAALLWLLADAGVPIVIAAPPARLGAGRQLLEGCLVSFRPAAWETTFGDPLVPEGARALVMGARAGGIVPATSLADVREQLAAPPFGLDGASLGGLGVVLVLGPGEGAAPAGEAGAGTSGRLRVVVAHYVRPVARDAHGHIQAPAPAVLASWEPRLGAWEHFAWGVIPEIALRLGRSAPDLEADLHHRRDDLAGLVTAGVTAPDEVRRLIAGYHPAYGRPHGAH